MFWFNSKKKIEGLEKETKESFKEVKKDFENVSKWIKHLDSKNKQLFEALGAIRVELSSVNSELEGLRESVSLINFASEGKQLSKKQTAVYGQQAVYGVEEPVQTAVQTANFHDILQNLSSNERLILFTLMNAGEGMKLSYEDVARLLGKERSTIRGQINSIKQKCEGLLEESIGEKGKKRIFIREEIKEKLVKYAKVKIGGRGNKKSKK